MEGNGGYSGNFLHRTSWVSSRDNRKRLIFLPQQTPGLQLLLLEKFCNVVQKRPIWWWPHSSPKPEKPLTQNCLTLSLSSSCCLIPCPFQGSWTFCKQIVGVTGAGEDAATRELRSSSGILWLSALKTGGQADPPPQPNPGIQRCKDTVTGVQSHPLCGYKENKPNSQRLRRTLPPLCGFRPWAQTLVLLSSPGGPPGDQGSENRRVGGREGSLPPEDSLRRQSWGLGGCTRPCVRHSASSGPGTSSGLPPLCEDFAPAYPRPSAKKYLPQPAQWSSYRSPRLCPKHLLCPETAPGRLLLRSPTSRSSKTLLWDAPPSPPGSWTLPPTRQTPAP